MKVVEIGMVVRVAGIDAPEMVVTETVPGSDDVRCIWFDMNELKTAFFRAAILERAIE